MERRKNHSPEFKAKVALKGIREEMRLAKLSEQNSVHATQRTTWKRAAIERVAKPFVRRDAAPESVDDLRGVQLPFDPDRQAFPAVFVHDIELSERPAIVCSVLHEVVRADIVTISVTGGSAAIPSITLELHKLNPFRCPQGFPSREKTHHCRVYNLVS
jgi:hypothetical protein